MLSGQTTPAGLGVSTVRPSLDFETYSEAGYVITSEGKVIGQGSQGKGGLPVVGTAAYAEHPSTEVLCLFYDLKDGRGRRGWWPGCPPPQDLLDYVAAGGEVEAFNSTFEWYIWNMVCRRRYGWPPLLIEQTYCVMSRSRRWGLPGSLDNVCKALGTEPKDQQGKRLIQKLCRPHPTTKTRQVPRHTLATAPADFAALFAYCDQDVAAEDDAALRIPDLTPYERAVWLADQRINSRGVQVDVEALDAALDLQRQCASKYTAELPGLTGGVVSSVGEVAKMQAWLGGQGVHMPDMTADSVTEALQRDDLPDNARRVLKIRESLASANVKKLGKIRHQLSGDGRLRNQYMYCGAERTGRWSSAAADDNASNSQLQNITAKGPESKQCEDVNCERIFGAHHETCPHCGSWLVHELSDWTIEAVCWAIEDIKTRDLDYVERIWGPAIDLLCGCLRGIFVAKLGHDLICCDFSAVEAVALACLARCQWRIEVFNAHGRIYEESAARITGTPFDEFVAYKERTGQYHELRKKIGKPFELGCGYGGWIDACKQFGADKYLADPEIKDAVLAWRADSAEIVEFWGGQFRQTGGRLSDGYPEFYGLEGAAIQAVLYPGRQFWHNDISYGVHAGVMYCRLPSGRLLAYHDPQLVMRPGRFGRPDEYVLTFMGHNTNPKNGARGWVRMETYGGRLCENVVQAACADIQAEAMLRCESAGYRVVMHTHDELCAEVPEGWGSVEEMEAIMAERPTWASWWPLKAAGWRHKRYQKD